MVYYKDFDFSKLGFGKTIKSKLGTMNKYQYDGVEEPIRIQFPKLHGILDSGNNGVLQLFFPLSGNITDFLKNFEDKNTGALFKNSKTTSNYLRHFNKVSQNSNLIQFSMKLARDALIFTEQNDMITLQQLGEYLTEDCKIVCIASTPGFWISEKSYGNSWTVEQIKVYDNPSNKKFE